MTSFLQEYQRQPKLFIDLPSKGKWYDESIIEGNQFVQIPVFGMNAMDEILFKTPDALFSGDATAEVIKSCIPTIKDPWRLVGYDIDYVLIAIRIATYGESMDTTTMCPHCSATHEHQVNLTRVLDNFTNYTTDFSFELNGFTFHLSPITYRSQTDFSIENFTNERTLLQIARDQNLSDDEKNKQSQGCYNTGADINIRLAISYISEVTRGDQKETDLGAITEFVKSNDVEFFAQLKKKIQELVLKWNLPALDAVCGAEDCGKEYRAALDVDYANFFGTKFLHSRNLIS